LKLQNETIVGLVLHSPEKNKYRDEIVETADLHAAQIFPGASLRDASVIEAIRELKPDIAVSVLFGYILHPSLIQLFPKGCINLHPSLLPYNRGSHPNVWSILEGTPAGVTLHYIDAGIDTGDIIAQLDVTVTEIDTGATLHKRLELSALELFSQTWPAIRSNQNSRRAQVQDAGTRHRVRDLEKVDEIDPEATYKAKDLINLLRARTFPPYPGAYFRSGGRKVYLRLDLAYGPAEAQG
jgi:methionyl-tRNA formyltransferase